MCISDVYLVQGRNINGAMGEKSSPLDGGPGTVSWTEEVSSEGIPSRQRRKELALSEEEDLCGWSTMNRETMGLGRWGGG